MQAPTVATDPKAMALPGPLVGDMPETSEALLTVTSRVAAVMGPCTAGTNSCPPNTEQATAAGKRDEERRCMVDDMVIREQAGIKS
mmetsp:Transcript_8600/g.14521  ORF Transcript_8600/g.14521 Transcript_8600/m.14521 type:complete len:86 (-) Transcript_8600:48-305(-)